MARIALGNPEPTRLPGRRTLFSLTQPADLRYRLTIRARVPSGVS